MITKVCNFCKKEKVITEFYKKTFIKGVRTYHTYCIVCQKERAKRIPIPCTVCSRLIQGRKGADKCHSCSFKLGGKTKGDKHCCWKGDEVKYAALHMWVNKYKPKVEGCEHCGEAGKFDLANMGTYNREFSNWRYLCRRCHMKYDGLYDKLKDSERQSRNGKLSLVKSNRNKNGTFAKRQ